MPVKKISVRTFAACDRDAAHRYMELFLVPWLDGRGCTHTPDVEYGRGLWHVTLAASQKKLIMNAAFHNAENAYYGY